MEVIYILVGFIASMFFTLAMLKKQGAGNCKMCKTCEYYLDFEKREKEDVRE
jgi:hypothetical protein